MKALWILNSPIGTAAQVLGYSHAASGTWIATAEQQLKKLLPELVVSYAVLGFRDRVVTDESLECTVYELPLKQYRGKRAPKADIKRWEQVIRQEKPDLIHVWGTEFTFPLDVMDACGSIPVAVTIQGVVKSLAKYCNSDVPYGELMKGHRFSAFPAWIRAKSKEADMVRQVKYEEQILKRAQAVLLDNEWSGVFCNVESSRAELIDFPLAINTVFQQTEWKLQACERNTVFTIAPSSAMKGGHMLLKALALVKQQCPDVRLRIPGSLACGRLSAITEPPYFRYLRRLIRQMDLEDNVEFCGKLTSKQMAQELSRANVFVMPSKAENISTSLREAMWVGTPCITSLVGAVPELVIHNQNALCYRYEEYEVLAQYILQILKDNDLSKKLSENGNRTIQNKYPMDQPLTHCAQWYDRASRRELV